MRFHLPFIPATCAAALLCGALHAGDTTLGTPEDPSFAAFVEDLKSVVYKEIRRIPWDGTVYYENKEWLRDHIHILKATRYWQGAAPRPSLDPRTPLELWIRNQFADGLYPEIVVGAEDPHVTYTHPDYVKAIDGNRRLIRLEAENDIEYLMVQAVWQAWKATGDDAWLTTPLKDACAPLASLEKALMHLRTDTAKRWDAARGLTVRGVSCDTWDWVYGQRGRDANRRIEPDTPLAIFHGDNTGLYQAYRQLAEMQRRAAHDDARADYWDRAADDLRAALMKHAWNGDFFAHMVHTRPTVADAPAAWRDDFAADARRLSLSNAYALNRGIFTAAEASRVIGAFLDLRLAPKASLVRDWVTLEPGYRNVAAVLYPPGKYANGGCGTFTAGELMRGAYVWGFPGYGTDILNRLRTLFARDGELVFLYEPNGDVYDRKAPGYDTRALSLGGGGPAGWGTAAVFEALVAGLAGVRDIEPDFAQLTFAPAWLATPWRTAEAHIAFGVSDAFFAYAFTHEPATRRLVYRLRGNRCTQLAAAIPVPAGTRPARVRFGDRDVPFEACTGAPRRDLNPVLQKSETVTPCAAVFTLTRQKDAAETPLVVDYVKP